MIRPSASRRKTSAAYNLLASGSETRLVADRQGALAVGERLDGEQRGDRLSLEDDGLVEPAQLLVPGVGADRVLQHRPLGEQPEQRVAVGDVDRFDVPLADAHLAPSGPAGPARGGSRRACWSGCARPGRPAPCLDAIEERRRTPGASPAGPGWRRGRSGLPSPKARCGLGLRRGVEAARVGEHRLVEVGRRPPQHDLVAGADHLAVALDLHGRGAPVVGRRTTPSAASPPPRWAAASRSARSSAQRPAAP